MLLHPTILVCEVDDQASIFSHFLELQDATGMKLVKVAIGGIENL
jgi:hypothetical protein